MSFPPSFQWASNIDPAWSDKEIVEHIAKVFEKYWYNAKNISVERNGDEYIIHWTWSSSVVSSLRCLYCSCVLEEKGTRHFTW